MPSSAVDHKATSVVAYRKSAVFEKLLRYGIRMTVVIEALQFVSQRSTIFPKTSSKDKL